MFLHMFDLSFFLCYKFLTEDQYDTLFASSGKGRVTKGRPGVGATFEDVEKISMAVAKIGVKFESLNPTTRLMADTNTGRFRDDIKTERVLSCTLEFKTEDSKMLSVINAFQGIARSVNTVFCVGCISRCRPDGTVPVKAQLDKAGIFYLPNGKINIGLGRPLAP